MLTESSMPTDADVMSAPRPPRVRGTLPFLGSALSIVRDPLAFTAKVRRDYGPIAQVSAGPQSFILLQGADGLREVLWEKGDIYPKPKLGMATLEPLLGKSVATLTDNAEWESARRFVLPLFSAKMLRAYFEEAVSSISGELARLDALAQSGEVVDIYHFMHAATFRVLIRTIFREGIGPEEVSELTTLFDEVTGFINVRYLTLGMPVDWALPAARRGKRALEKLNERVYRLIAERREKGVGEAFDMLDALIAAEMPDGSKLSDKAIRDNCMTLLFGGHETTAGSLTWTWGLLSKYPEKRKLLQQNVDEALGHELPTDVSVLQKLDYVDNAFSEAMRLYPMFGMLFREATQPDVVEGHRLEPGDLIGFSAHTLQHAEDLWVDPESFVPERHTQEGMKAQNKFAYLPFSHGKRRCIGERMARMEADLMLAIISQRFELDLVGDLPEVAVRMSLKPVGGMPMKIRRRSSTAA